MITEKETKKIIDLALEHGHGKAAGLEVSVSASDIATSRFANNSMTQNQAPMAIGVSLRAIVDGRQARLSSDNISPAGIKQLVDNAITCARLLEKDPQLLPLYKPQIGAIQLPVPDRYDASTAHLGPDKRAHAVNTIIDTAKAQGLSAAGVFASGSTITAIGNSEGLFAVHRETEVECSITMSAKDSTGWVKAQSTRSKDLNVKKLAQTAAVKAVSSANPIELEPGHYTVILEPSAVLDLLCFLWEDFTGTSHIDKQSCFLDKVGKKILGSNINIVDDVSNPLQAGAAFDGEGLPRTKVVLVENGVIKNLVLGRRAAVKLGATPTGHGLEEPSPMGEYPLNLVISGGTSSVDEMIKGCERGILLTRVWYVREVDPATKIVTGMTRDGTFLVENGKIKSGVKNFRFNQSIIEMLNNVVALGPTVRATGEESFPAAVPAMLVNNFNMSSITKF